MIAAWVAGLTAVVLATGSSFGSLYDTAQKRADLAASMNGNASLRAFYGPMFGWDGTGALTAWRFTVLGAALTGLMAAFVVVRHTRDDEESGRQELVSAGAVGRRAPLTAALGTAVGAGFAVGLCVALGSAANGGSVAGAAMFGLDLAAGAAVFAGVAAVAAQVAETGRGARGIAGAVLAAAYLLRAAGDAATDDASSPLVWVSPLGWIENTRPYAGDRWWVLLLPFVFAAICAAAAYALAARRDVGAGLVAGRPGPRPPRPRSPGRSRSPGGCTAARSPPGRPASRSPGSSTVPSRAASPTSSRTTRASSTSSNAWAGRPGSPMPSWRARWR
ncbi:hypothetical protein ACU686_02430 [Yinghuangia aomiensis]